MDESIESLIEENAKLREQLAALTKDRDEWKESCCDANTRFQAAEAKLKAASEQEPVAWMWGRWCKASWQDMLKFTTERLR